MSGSLRKPLAALFLLLAAAAHAAEKPTPPSQPKAGPGGADYAHAEVRESILGEGDSQVWVFEPARPAPEKAPAVILIHGWAAMSAEPYRAWINHVVRRGNVVIYPRYQASILTLPETMTGNAAAAVKAALAELRKEGHVHADETKVAAVGHSLGGVIVANLAANAKALGIPQPRAVMSVEPGDSKGARFGVQVKSILSDYSTIPGGTLFLIVVGDEDAFVADRTAKDIWAGIKHLPKDDRDFATVLSDRHGSPELVAGHFFPTAAEGIHRATFVAVDALDYFGTWKLLDGLTDAAFHGRNRHYALGNTIEQRFMGKWSDGTPVKELRVLDK